MTMGTIRKIEDDYYIEFEARGLKYQRNGGKDKDAALQLLHEVEDKIQKGEMSIVVHDVQARDFFKDCLVLIKNDNDQRTTARYESVVKHFQEFIRVALSPTCKLSQVTPSVIEGYRTHLLKSTDNKGRALKPKTINFTLHLLRDIFDYGINFGHINDNPTLHVRFMKAPDTKPPQILNADNIRELLNNSSNNVKVRIQLLLKTGISIEELAGLKWANVDLINNCLKIEPSPGTTLRGRSVPMDSKVVTIVRKLHDQKKEHQEYIFSNEAGEMSSINSKFNFSVLRNTFAKRMLEKGISLVVLSKLLGFKDIARVMRYAGLVKV